MNLPVLGQLRSDESTYISFSKGLLDLDKSINYNTKYYLSKMVAIKLPFWQNPDFFIDLNSVGEVSTNPNIVIPKAIQFYMENIIRQSIGINDVEVDEVVELAFWKLMSKMGLNESARKSMFTFTNAVSTSNFITTENNNGWAEIVAQIPNKCKLLVPAWKTLDNIKDIVQGNTIDTCLYDNGLNQFLFSSDQKQIIDFDNCTFNEVDEQEFEFNVLLLYYIDSVGKHKLHGINFIYPFQNKVTYWDLETFIQKTNAARTIGYQFLFNMKSCNNEASLTVVYDANQAPFWNNFSQTLSGLNSFLETKMREASSDIN
jgi:hypothetical protein